MCSDHSVFLTLLLYGDEAAVNVASAEAFSSSFLFSKLFLTRFFNGALLATSTFVVSQVIERIFGPPVELTRAETTGLFVAAMCVLAMTQYVVNSGLAAVRLALKTHQPLWSTWKEYFLWTSITYFAGGSAAGITAKLI